MAESEIVFIVRELPEGGYGARAMAHSIFTQAESVDELCTMIDDAVRCHFEPESSVPFILVNLQK